MPITFSPISTNLGEITVVENFTKTISAVTNEWGDSIVSVTVAASTPNSGVILSNGTTSCSISGNYETPFTNTKWNWLSSNSYFNTQNYLNVPNAIGNLIKHSWNLLYCIWQLIKKMKLNISALYVQIGLTNLNQ